MAYNVVTSDLDIIRQQSIKKIIRLYILDFNYARVAEISGNMLAMNVSIDSESDLRRSCSIELVVVDDSYNVAAGGRIWLDKYIQPYIGYENIHTGEVQWYNQGIYLINAPSWQYDAETKVLSFAGLDLMSKLTGLRNGQLEGLTYSIPAGQNVRNVIIDTIKLAGFNNYIVSECRSKNGAIVPTPYDIEISAGGTVYDILSELRDIMPNYEMFFDVDGVFIYQPIPTGQNVPVKIDDTMLKNVLLNEAVDTDFETVKNYIEVYGQTYDPDYYSATTTYSGGVLNLSVSGLSTTAASVPNGILIGFTALQDINGAINVKLNNLTSAMPLIDQYGESTYNFVSGGYYIIQWNYTDAATSPYYYIGKQQISAIAKDDNPDSPFYISGSVGMIREVLSGGEYDNIITDSLAQQQADYSLWQKTRLQDSIALSITPVPWLDVNDIIGHKAVGASEAKKYIVKNISTDYGQVDGMQTITAITYYPLYPDI